MPAGNKLKLIIVTDLQQTFQIVTWMTPEQIRGQIHGTAEFAGKVAIFNGINDHDEEMYIEVERAHIKAHMVGPYHKEVQTIPMPPGQMPRGIRQ